MEGCFTPDEFNLRLRFIIDFYCFQFLFVFHLGEISGESDVLEGIDNSFDLIFLES